MILISKFRITLIIFIISTFIFLASGSEVSIKPTSDGLSTKKKEKCTYFVTTETTCTKGADTTNHVSLRFGDENSNDILVHHLNSKHVRRVDQLEPQVLDDIPRKPFQSCMVDQFQVIGQCVKSPICYLYLKLAGNDDWRPGFAQVQVLQGPHFSSNMFYFRRYLPRRVWHGLDLCETQVTPFGLKRKRNVTGDRAP
ncbi:embryo-specific protein ATS3A-like isoform X3 [Solanum pennellii]|uniref:Embryo-specific protein ATS3A-like isoform X3 n=1 Tax=Solanum pennellii TaxID=28526 RepID=A0ABM1FJX4_SOLPN|nr:embryo-specific protein ATS3A-like isoform X3 [Solanum pennellii]